MKKYIFCTAMLLWIFSIFNSIAQDFKYDYSLLKSVNPIPNDFLKLSSEKFESDKKTLDTHEKKRIVKNKKEFLLTSNFSNDYILASGRVLFNDTLSKYCNGIVDILLKDNAPLRSKIRCYAVKSTSVNAFTTQSGIIYITTGLVAQVETEAQLAFILSHEIIHFEKNHNINAYVESREIERGKGVYRNQSFDDKVISKSKYSKENENEADLKGLDRFLKTNYNTENLERVFDILQYSYLPFEDKEFKKSFFETDFYQFPENYFSGDVNPIKPPDDIDETSTHPSIEKRRKQLKEQLALSTSSGKKDYLLSREAFNYIRSVARFEVTYQHYIDNEFLPALYTSYLLTQDFPENYFLQKNIAKSLYSISKYAESGDKRDVIDKPDEIQGEQYRLYNLMYQMNTRELNVLALRYCYDLYAKHDSDADLKNISESLIKQLVTDDDFKKDMFRKEPRAAYVKAAQSLASKDTVKKSDSKNKLDKIKSQEVEKKLSADTSSSDYYRYAFVKNFKDERFSSLYDNYFKENDEAKKKRESETSEQRKARIKIESSQRRKRERQIRKHGYSIGAEKVVIVTPGFLKADERKRQMIQYLASESWEMEYMQMLIKDAELLKLKIEILDQHRLQQNDAETFNDIAFLNDWINKRFDDIDQGITLTDRKKLDELIKKYNTRYFYWGGVINLREKKNFNYVYVILMIYTWPLIPMYAYLIAKPQYETLHYAVVFDLEKGKPALTSYNVINKNSQKDVLHSNIYDVLYQIKKSPKKK